MQTKTQLDLLFTKHMAGLPTKVILDGEVTHFLHEDNTWYPVPNYTVQDLLPWLATFQKWRITQYSEGFFTVTVHMPSVFLDIENSFDFSHDNLAYAMMAAMLATKGFDAYAD